jgi:hypothetical protein
MERYCGYVKRSTVRSRKHALASIDNRILETTQLEMAKMRYGLTKSFLLSRSVDTLQRTSFLNCPSHPPVDSIRNLMAPNRSSVCTDVPEADTPCQLQPQAAAHRSHCDKVQPELCGSKDICRNSPKYVPSELTEWGRVQIYDTGDRARGRALRKPESSTRDCCFVRVCHLPSTLPCFLSH